MRGGGLATLMLLMGCTMPPLLYKEDVLSLIHQLFPVRQADRFLAYGEATFSIDGEVHACGIEVKADTDTFRADFYGPLGIPVGSISAAASSGRGSLRFRDKEYRFDLSQTVSIPSLGANSSLTYSDLLRVLRGRVPQLFEDPLEKSADSVYDDRAAITLLWKTDSLGLRVRITKRPAAIAEVELIPKDKEGEGLRLSSFRNGRATIIEVRESDGNYFSVTYTRVKPQ